MKDKSIKNIIEQGYCIGCGSCSVLDTNISINKNNIGLLQAKLKEGVDHYNDNSSDVCPFGSTEDEDTIARSLYANNANYDKSVGYYEHIYSGYRLDKHRVDSSSGGLTNWLLVKLLEIGEIDGVIHVGESSIDNSLFEYCISSTPEEIQNNSKSRYYPVHFDKVLNQIKLTNKKYAFVGVPCHIKAIRLLMLNDQKIKNRVKYCFAIFCGHSKSSFFAEMIGWQASIKPKELKKIDFRIKNPSKKSSQYSVQVIGHDLLGPKEATMETSQLFGMDWGVGLFKPLACDWCDDIAGEVADIAMGDAWLPEYINDPGGRNIVVVRNKILLKILKSGVDNGDIYLADENVEKVYESQAGNFRHRQEGLSVRLIEAEESKKWHPIKRIKRDTFKVPCRRKKIYLLRSLISKKSHVYFSKAKEKDNFFWFLFKIFPLEVKYYFLNKRLVRFLLVTTRRYINFFKRSIR